MQKNWNQDLDVAYLFLQKLGCNWMCFICLDIAITSESDQNHGHSTKSSCNESIILQYHQISPSYTPIFWRRWDMLRPAHTVSSLCGGFLRHRATPIHHPHFHGVFSMVFPWKKKHYFGYPLTMETPKIWSIYRWFTYRWWWTYEIVVMFHDYGNLQNPKKSHLWKSPIINENPIESHRIPLKSHKNPYNSQKSHSFQTATPPRTTFRERSGWPFSLPWAFRVIPCVCCALDRRDRRSHSDCSRESFHETAGDWDMYNSA